MAEPVRLQLSRKKGFSLQALSQATNGLECVNVARPSPYGNPFPLSGYSREEAVRRFTFVAKSMARLNPEWLGYLRGKNLACFCKPADVCHADILLALAASRPSS